MIRSVLKEVQQREKIESLSRYKTKLLSIISHQIKNPLAIIQGYASLIRDKTVNEPKAINEVSQKIHNNARELINLLNNLLDWSHLEEGKLTYNFEKIELNGFLKGIIEDSRFGAEQKNLKLNFEPFGAAQGRSLPQEIQIEADKVKLGQIFRNLIDNAIKYTEKGFVKIQYQLKENKVLVSVSDSGQGIPKESLPNLFQKFVRVEGEEKRSVGSGLGLYISKEIVEAHHGRIWAESEGEGRGSKFVVELPIEPVK